MRMALTSLSRWDVRNRVGRENVVRPEKHLHGVRAVLKEERLDVDRLVHRTSLDLQTAFALGGAFGDTDALSGNAGGDEILSGDSGFLPSVVEGDGAMAHALNRRRGRNVVRPSPVPVSLRS